MEIVVLNSDIARLVFGYLKSQKLKKASHTFCKTSPYLKQEFSAYKQGLQTHSFFPELEEIICEFVKISRKVEEIYPKLKDALPSKLTQCKLSEKVNDILEHASHAILSSNVSAIQNDNQSYASKVVASQSNHTVDENDGNHAKRKRSLENSNNSSNETNINKLCELSSSRSKHYSKKRRVQQPYCFLNAKGLHRHKLRYCTTVSTTDEDVLEGENEESQSSIENANDNPSGGSVLSYKDDCNETEIFDGEKPTKESTPRSKLLKKCELVAPEISQAILDNFEFQQKLVENINQALNNLSVPEGIITNCQNSNSKENSNPPVHDISGAGAEITSSQILDRMVETILNATEKEPSYDAIIQELAEASNKPQLQSTEMQCSINSTNVTVAGNPPLFIGSEAPPPLVPVHSTTQLQQYPAPISSPTTGPMASIQNVVNLSAVNEPSPRTPIVLRSASGATATCMTSGVTDQDPSSLLVNNSFGPLIDPNFSISKLIVLNSNDSAQKQLPENCIGNTTAENIIGHLSTSGVVDTNDEQVFFDTTTGQLTFPIFLTNDGLLANFPFLINNEYVNQQLQTNNMGNSEGSRLEIPLSEPIMVNANQRPPNSIILSSGQRENIATIPETVEKASKDSQIKYCHTVPPASLDNRLLCDKATPSSNGILNTKAFKSLSTPRKRSSHVRTLTFSPGDSQTLNHVGTPLSTRRDVACRFPRSLPKAILEGYKEKSIQNESKQQKDNNALEKVVIETVEILPSILKATSETLTENTNVSTNDSNIPPLFVNEESSNQTIIDKHVLVSTKTLQESIKSKDLTFIEDNNTPIRKQPKKTAVRSCKRQLSKCSNENELFKEKPEQHIEEITHITTEQADITPKDNMMEEWVRLRNSNKVDLDVRLREINAKSIQSTKIKKVNTKKKVRRKKTAAVKKKEKELAKKAEEIEKSKEQINETQDQSFKEHPNILSFENKSCVESESTKEAKFPVLNDKSDQFSDENTTKVDKKPREKQKNNEELVKQTENNARNSDAPSPPCQVLSLNQTLPPDVNELLEREKRTTNIAFLLETPYKDPNFASCHPPTPGIFAPSLETPANKIKDPHDEMQASASFLFGSNTKSELDTPIMSALTPGFRYTPFGLKEIGTPKSAPGTDYSSGGSYYKPDESEDLNLNIEKRLRNSVQSKANPETTNNTDDLGKEEEEDGEIVEEQLEKECSEDNEIDKIEVEIPAEKLKVEPIVLKRVKSFGNETVDCLETAKINPHYTLVSGLPEISAAEEECSSSSSSSSKSTSSSKSSSSSSSSASSSSSSSSSSSASVKSKTVIEMEQSTKSLINNLENLSEISSTEDEDWQKLAVTDNDENSQLVNNDGEVRYPVRSWLTPLKENITIERKTVIHKEITEITSAKHATLKVTLPLKSAEKTNKQVKELELKKERIKEKLKSDASTITKKDKPATSATAPPNISAALAASRTLHAMRDKGKKPTCYQPSYFSDTTVVETTMPIQEKRSLDVLTALNLSARKHLVKPPENKQTGSDETVWANLPINLKGESKINISQSITNKTPQRKCLPIEARPVTRTIRKTGKKIVRTPLAFKVIHSPGKINSHSTTTTLAELAATKTLNKSKESAVPSIQHTLRVSPRLLKPSKVRGKPKPCESPTPKSKATTRSAKAASVAANAKATRLQKKKKEAVEAPSEKDMKSLSKGCKEVSLENRDFKDETKPISTTAIKPKIHLKARNAMISTKCKTISKKEELIETPKKDAKSTEIRVLNEEVYSLQHHYVESNSKATDITPQTVNVDPLPPTTQDEDNHLDEDPDDEDPLDDCEIFTMDETDTRRFIKFAYDGPEGPPAAVAKKHDFSNFQMVVAIDEHEKHVWRISEGICLFSCAPSLSKPTATIPKKRKIRTTSVTSISENTTVIVSAASTAPTNTEIGSIKAFSTNNPTATSTPVALQTASRKLDENGKTSSSIEKDGSKSKADIKQQPAETSKKFLPATTNENTKIQIEDIESILSHLHGT